MTLREALALLNATRAPTPLRLHKLEKTVSKIVSSASTDVPKETHLEELERFQDRATRLFLRRGIDGLELKDLRRLPEALWVPPQPLDNIDGLFTSLITKLKIIKSASVMRRLLGSYLRDYPTDFPSFSAAARFIRSEMSSPNLQRLPLFRAWDAGLFRGEADVDRTARLVLDKGEDGLRAIGIGEDLWISPFRPGLIELAFRRACAIVAAGNGESDQLTSFATEKDGAFRFSALHSRIAMLEALVLPWKQQAISEEKRRQVLRTIIRFFNDPRVARERWEGIPTDLKAIILQWLTRSSIEQFLGIVDHSLRGDAHERGMWRFRRAFWMHCLDTGLIDEAWVVFGKEAKAEARKANLSGFAEFEGPQDPKKSALIMRMGDVTIAEWSHNGRCWIWPTAGEVSRAMARGGVPEGVAPPELYLRFYAATALQRAPRSTVHRDPESGAWQDKVADTIRELTGRMLRRSDYMPKD